MASNVSTLYEWLGGSDVSALIEWFYEKVLSDPLLEPMRKRLVKV
jgi:truncated hemoglobin YjbI